MTKKYINEISYQIIGAAIEVHKRLGPGLLESVYQKCLEEEFLFRNINFQSQLYVEIVYRNIEIGTQLRCDFLVEDLVVVEIKSVEAMPPIFDAQILSYMKLLNKPKGILINFNVENIFKNGQKTFVNELFRVLP